MYDVSAHHRQSIDENRKVMASIQKEKPDTYFTDAKWRRLAEQNRVHQRCIDDYEHALKRGAKF